MNQIDTKISWYSSMCKDISVKIYKRHSKQTNNFESKVLHGKFTHFRRESRDTDLSVHVVCTIANRLEPRSGPIYVGPDLGSSLFASSTILFRRDIAKIKLSIGADRFFMAAILYPRLQWVNNSRK